MYSSFLFKNYLSRSINSLTGVCEIDTNRNKNSANYTESISLIVQSIST